MTRRVQSKPQWGVLGVALAGALGCVVVSAAQVAAAPVNVNLVLLDPAHGGPDPGAHLNGSAAEKDVTLALAARLRASLVTKGFSVIATRDGDTGMTSVQRAEMANHAHPVACLLLHATSSGSGVYLGASSLAPELEARAALPWETAQAWYIPQSLSLLDGMVRSVTAISVKPVVLRASVPPIDSLTCATVLVEMAPAGGKAVTDEGYQQKVVDGLVDALVAWRTQETPVKTPTADANDPSGVAAPAKPRARATVPSATTPPNAPGAPQ